MARAAYRRAAALTPFGTPVLGVAATCALASEPPKRGEHRAYVAAHDGVETTVAAVLLEKGARGRWAEDGAVSRVLLQVGAAASRERGELRLRGRVGAGRARIGKCAC
jgi:hypothetical protein